MLRCLPDLERGNWNLSEQDAVEGIREAYLKNTKNKLSEGETRNLMRLAVLSEFELSLSEQALVDPLQGFDIANRKMGLVFRQKAGGKEQYVVYRLAHAALGKLLLAAAFEPVDVDKEQQALALANPYTGFALAHRLTKNNQTAKAKAILLALMEKPGRLLAVPNLSHTLNALRRIQQLEVAPLDKIGSELVSAENRPRLIERALLTPLDSIQSFMSYAEAEKTGALKAAFDALAEDLGKDEYRPSLIERALLTPLDGIQSFMSYAEAEKTGALKAAFDALAEDLGKDEYRPQLVKQFTSAPLDQIVSVLSADVAHELWQAILKDVDAEEWGRIRLQENTSKANAFFRLQQLATAQGRPELMSALALRLVQLAEAEQWQPPNGTIRNLSHVLRFAGTMTEDEIRRFLQQIATEDWVDQQVGTGAQTGGLAGSLLALSNTLPPAVRTPFLRPSLRRRVLKEITTDAPMEVQAWVEALSLLGAAAALGLRLDSVKTNWPRKEKFNAILESRLPHPESTAIGHLQVQFWLGLREMCRLRSDSVIVAAKYGNAILVLWRATHQAKVDEIIPAHVRELNAGMIAWLERCQKSGWRLVRDA
ncbi:MAG: hypothetical protein HYZ46_05320 [Nitrosomonadales bacterium]|nr:hypothetical protein [Nitrosomonadales bacterium]